MNDIPGKLREQSTHALMSASRELLHQAADEIERLRIVIRCYAESSAAAAREIRKLKDDAAT